MNAFDVAESRFEEAREITDALRDRMRNLRRELRATQDKDGDVLAVVRRVRSSTLELVEAEAYEARCWSGYSSTRLASTGKPVSTPRMRRTAA